VTSEGVAVMSEELDDEHAAVRTVVQLDPVTFDKLRNKQRRGTRVSEYIATLIKRDLDGYDPVSGINLNDLQPPTII
jgi:hypothetical protein